MDAHEPATPLPGGPSSSSERRSTLRSMNVIYTQAWGLCVAYLAMGLGAEIMRRLGIRAGAVVQEFLDGVPLYAIRMSGQIEGYLRASALGLLTPFWNRLLLASITVVVILAQATLIGAVVVAGTRIARRGRSAA